MGALRLLAVFVGAVSVSAACSTAPQPAPAETPSMKNLVFLTRVGCVNTVTMRANLDDALKVLGLPNDYLFINADTLQQSDPRGGYGTPTVLYDDRDLFGMTEPTITHPAPT
jgi:hypothetical protein